MSSAQRTILIVDDNDRLAAYLEKYLRREGFGTAVAATGTAALRTLGGQPSIDLLLLNLKLPDMTGEELLAGLAERNQPMPYIVLAEHGDQKRAAQQLRRCPRLPDEGRFAAGADFAGGPPGG